MGREKADTERKPAAPRRTPTADEVEAYLKAHPDYLNDRPQVLAHLTPPARRNGDNVLDMQQFMLRRLQAEVDRLSGYQRDLISTTRGNLAAQGQIHAACLALMEATGFEHLIHICTKDLPALLDVDAVTLCVEAADELSPRHPRTRGVHVIEPGTVRMLLNGNEVLLLENVPGDRAIFGPAAGLVRSQALIRLRTSSRAPEGLLALGAREADRFESGQATELLGFLARLLERLIRGWLSLPP